MEEELRRFSEFLVLARAYKASHTGFIRNLVYRARPDRASLDKDSGKDLVSAAQLVSATFTLMQGYQFEDPDLERVKREIVFSLREPNDILVNIAKQTAERIGLPVVSSESPIASKELILGTAKRSFGL